MLKSLALFIMMSIVDMALVMIFAPYLLLSAPKTTGIVVITVSLAQTLFLLYVMGDLKQEEWTEGWSQPMDHSNWQDTEYQEYLRQVRKRRS